MVIRVLVLFGVCWAAAGSKHRENELSTMEPNGDVVSRGDDEKVMRMMEKLTHVVGRLDSRFEHSFERMEKRMDALEQTEQLVLANQQGKAPTPPATKKGHASTPPATKKGPAPTRPPTKKSAFSWSHSKSPAKVISVEAPKKVEVPTPAPDSNGGGSGTPGGGIAVVLRGEAFRDWGLGNNGFRLVMNCGCQDALDAQEEIYKSHMTMKKQLLEDGWSRVDFFGASYPCSNGAGYEKKIPEWYGDELKVFKLLDYATNSQWSMYQHALDLLPNQGQDYEQILVLRWDYKMLNKFNKCLFDAPIPMDARDATGNANYDIFDVWSSKWFDVMRNSVNPDGSAGGVGKLKCHPNSDAEKALGWARQGAPCEGSDPGVVYDEEKCPLSVRHISQFSLMEKWTAEQQNGQSHLPFSAGDGCNSVCTHVADEILKNTKSQGKRDAYCARITGCCAV